ncbi:MAG TPA: hypothetical protein VKV18_07185 [Chthonomonas sp.]|uniref:hypothetical protein n=1 Tax=Chthonomonas sp. TaxID=2282153 RepID=UPI002B4B2D52|nr:hypothetical protein [Chthonomonas sp.]HLI48450.1 hypothetical protein [Chthonomonas sp.]
MARIVTGGVRRDGEAYSSRMGLSEFVILICLIGAIAWGVNYYFNVYRKSPTYALKVFLGAIEAGRSDEQYNMLSDYDKMYYPTEKQYENSCPLAHGYTERLPSFDLAPPKPDQNPGAVQIDATLHVTSNMAHEALYQAGTTHTVHVIFRLIHDQNGQWKVWLQKSNLTNLLQITPNPPGSNF